MFTVKWLPDVDGSYGEKFKNISCLRLSKCYFSIIAFKRHLKTFHVYG